MLKFRGRFSFPKFDLSGYNKKLEEACETQVRQAARAWLRAAYPRVPVWTGTARASLSPLGRFLNVAVPVSPEVVRKGMGPAVGANLGSFKFERRGQRFIFKVETHVPHYIANDQTEAPNPPFALKNPTPWNSFEAGDAAFKEYMKDNLAKRIPKIKDYIRFKTQVIH